MLKILVAAACVTVIAATVYFIRNDRHDRAEAAEAAQVQNLCNVARKWGKEMLPQIYASAKAHGCDL